jgi:hypothetical protein
MKKLFEIDNSEKQRILEMHIDATRKLYLNEQETNEPTGYNSVIVKGAEQHTENALSQVKNMADKKFGANNYQILQTNLGYIAAKNNVYEAMKELEYEIRGGGKIENTGPQLELMKDGKVGYYNKKPDGFQLTFVSGADMLYNVMKKHLLTKKGGLTSPAHRASVNRKVITEFYNDPKNKFGELCNILNPYSVFKMDGFPGIDITCKLGDDYVWKEFNPNDYIRVDGRR